jgi:hypothetical protein
MSSRLDKGKKEKLKCKRILMMKIEINLDA